MLNENWDKIDGAIGKVQTDLGNIKVDIPDATLTSKGKVQLSSSTSGTSESLAATEKALKTAKAEAISAADTDAANKANAAAADSKAYADTQIAYVQAVQKNVIRPLEREVANLNLQLAAKDRVPSGVTFGQDFASGAAFGMNVDFANVKATADLPAGTTVLTGKVDNPATFSLGQKVTVLGKKISDSTVTSEEVTVTRAEQTTTVNTVDRQDVSVVNSTGFTTAGNGGRKVVLLSNGWLVSILRWTDSASVRYFVSKDNGASWAILCTYQTSSTTNSVVDAAIQSNGTTVYTVITDSASLTVSALMFDATTVPASPYATGAAPKIDSGQAAIGNVSIAINEAGTELHAAWASKNSTYPNSFNIRYAKGIIAADGSVTWGAAEQVTQYDNSAVSGFTNPSIVIDRAANPTILTSYQYTTSIHYIAVLTKAFTLKTMGITMGTGWGNRVVYQGNAFGQSSPSAIFVPQSINGLANGRIWVAWTGTDTTDTGANNIRVSFSDDMGITWSAMQKLTSGNTVDLRAPSITANKRNEIFIVYYGGSSQGIKRVENKTGTWGNQIAVATGDMTLTSALYDLTFDFDSLLFVYKGAAKVGFYGTWKINVTSAVLEISGLVNSYKSGAKIARTTAQISNGALRFGGFEDVVTNNVTDASVVNSAYDTSGNGGRKLVRLSNGWLVSTSKDTSGSRVYFHVSKDNGATWSQLCYTDSTGDWAIANMGTDIYYFSCANGTSTHMHKIDVLTQTNTNIWGVIRLQIEASQTALGNCSLAINDAGTELHAAWTSKNSTYPNSWNIRYAKGIIAADGTVTWSTAVQASAANSSGYDILNPSVLIQGSKFFIVAQCNVGFADANTISAARKSILALTNSLGMYTNHSSLLASGWSAALVYQDTTSNGYAQNNPSAILVPQSINGLASGRLWVVWHGLDATDTAVHNIRVSYSDDGGVTWSAGQKLTSGNIYSKVSPSITADKNNNIYVLFHGRDASDAFSDLRLIKNTAGAWGSEVVVANGATNAKINATALVDLTLDVTTPLYIYQDSQSGKIGFYGTWKTTGTIPFTDIDVRFTIKDTSEAVLWARRDAALTVDATLNGQAMDKTTVGNEDQFVRSLGSTGPVEIKLKLKRASTATDVGINKILGGVG
ncbi:Phage tail fiber repeat protein [compost metagenome]